MMIQNLWEEEKAAQEARKFSNKQPNLTPKAIEKEEQTTPKLVEENKS